MGEWIEAGTDIFQMGVPLATWERIEERAFSRDMRGGCLREVGKS